MRAGTVRRLLAAGAAAGVLASAGHAAGPVWAAESPALPAPPAVAEATDSGLSEAALQEAVVRDLGMTAEEFAAAGELGTAAAEVANWLQNVPGYAGVRLQDGHILVSGSGAELLAEVAVLSSSIPVLAVEDPAPVRQGKAAGKGAELQPRGTELAVSTEELFQAYIREVGTDGLQAVVSSGGKFVIRTGGVNLPESTAGRIAGSTAPAGTADATAGAGSGKKSAAEFVSRYANVELDGGTPLAPEADVPGGVGFIADTGWVCSTGFSAFDPSGLPAVLTAGHCASDGAATTADLTFQGVSVGLLGSFGFSQFGGPGNSWIAENPLDPDNPGNVGTDIAVIDHIRADLDPLAAASTFGDPEQPGPDVKIIGTAEPVEGMDVCRSGKTSGWSCGTVHEVGIYTVPGQTYVEPSDTTDPAEPVDLRAFRGFLSYDVQSSGGDSGGPYVSGNYAVGTHAAGEAQPKTGELPPPNQAIGATLTGSLAVLPGYQLELFLNKPVVSTPAPGATYEPGQAIGGTVPAAPASAVAAGSAVRITVQGQEPFEVPVNADGGWSFPASGAEGTLRFTAETVNGFSTSGTSSFEFAPAVQVPPVPAAPQEPSPVDPPAAEPAPSPAEPAPAPAPVDPEPAPVEPAAADPAPAAPPAPADHPPAVVVPPADTAPPAGLAITSGTPYDRTHRGGTLANTGASALGQAAAAAGAAIVVGGVLMVLARRRRQRNHK